MGWYLLFHVLACWFPRVGRFVCSACCCLPWRHCCPKIRFGPGLPPFHYEVDAADLGLLILTTLVFFKRHVDRGL